MKIGVCTLRIGDVYKRRTQYTHINKLNYCDKHSYTFIDDESVYDDSKPIPWSKLKLLEEYLQQFDYLVWIDADILIMNQDIKLESFIEKYPTNIICGSDWRMTNTGVLFVKNTEWSMKFLEAIWLNVYDPEDDPKERYMNWEQGSFINLHDRDYMSCRKHITITCPNEMNSCWFNYYPNDFVLHLCGIRDDNLLYESKRYSPDFLPDDTQETYLNRKNWLKSGIREMFDDRLNEFKAREARESQENY
jgi:hypothetical protein